ncbi:MAG: methionine--tRNA ligase [Aigarchaeota archaeon]|nr:methionine--tRNA ligase [Aigarchaeota archaeon]MDW8093251.1 methionine--tRNA ligase [Nitrososphaerota archaeon]
MERLKVLVTAALPYSYAPRHFGHLAGVYLPADVMARYMRLRGHETVFVSGTDENATSIVLEAMRRGMGPKELCDTYYPLQRSVFDQLGISFDIFSRTSSPIHYKVCEEFYRRLWEKGFVYPKKVLQLYCPKDEKSLPDRFVIGTCPKCGALDQYGEVCEACGSFYEAYELKEPRCSLCGSKPVLKESVHFFLKLSALTERVLDYVRPKVYWRKAAYNKTVSWLEEEGLRDKDITREYDWGPPAPFPGSEGQVLYNWVENLLGYISATKELSINLGNPRMYLEYWTDPNTKIYCFLGKDNLFFHTILFPAILIAHGDYTLPHNVVVSEFVGLMGRKISTSKGWVVWLHDLLKQYDPDVIRFYAIMIAPETKDTDFDWEDFREKVNNVLIATYGNFINRVMSLVVSRCGGVVPKPGKMDSQADRTLSYALSCGERVAESVENSEIRAGFLHVLNLAQEGNRYLSEARPWEGESDYKTVLYVLIQVVHALSVISYPYLPFTSARVRRMLNVDERPARWDEYRAQIPPGHNIGKPEILFRKIGEEEIKEKIRWMTKT